MKPLLQAENITKRWGELLLFENLSLTLFEGDKVGLIARNGAGKSTLLSILARNDKPDSGTITLSNDVRIGYFEQLPVLNQESTVINEIFNTANEKLTTVKEFDLAVIEQDLNKIATLSVKMDQLNAWDAEVEIKQILSELKINDLNQKIKELSGGQQKRLALAKVLVSEPNLLILDEPTNHLDLYMVEWLEEYLGKSKATLLLVTHDRYFLDRVCNAIIEIDNRQLYSYRGNYSFFLTKREERIQAQNASVLKAKNLFRTELEWMRRMPKARTHKAKYRTEAFYELREKATLKFYDKTVDLSVQTARLGKKIAEIKNVSFAYNDGIQLVKNFSYTFSRFEKIGIAGNNGTGKTTFLNLLTGILTPDKGTIDTGSTVKFGYYRQEGIQFNPQDKVIDAVKKTAEETEAEEGNKISATQLLNQFLFSPESQYNYIEKLSGGELRRLYLCTVLMQNPNFLILDEPTNDLDLLSLNVLEEYLRTFEGCVVIVSHDRFFMDKIADHIFIFKGDGIIRDFPGNYTQFRDHEEKTATKPKQTVKSAPEKPIPIRMKKEEKKKMTFSELKEFGKLEQEIASLEETKKNIEELLNSGTLNHGDLFARSNEISRISKLLDEKELRWLELSELEQ